ncbi:MAG: bifunctional UDP-N-acetylglucosamine diphosphorylase/glucosamine-1-phosphate N-acetyltransferase GlmU [Bdellovibrionales bacterium]|nr:bifunctional UDP-N-acetylglucosamine diphosphorylase/glucosamine-1-phosphate N-acetyltransferase GlmU [Bdellovibrionales bacterium]
MESIIILVLAAGKGTRMLSDRAKVLHEACGKSLIQRLLTSVAELSPERVIVVTGHQKQEVEANILEGSSKGFYKKESLGFAFQEKQLGTGHAAKCALPELKDFNGTVVILPGDTPLLTSSTLKRLLEIHKSENATASILSFVASPESAYGRIIRNEETGLVEKIVEFKDCSPEQLKITEVNSGMYAIDSDFLKPALEEIKNDNAQGEFYLPDIIEKAFKEGQNVAALMLPNEDELIGVNTRIQLSQVEKTLKRNKINQLIENGVYFSDPDSAHIDENVEIGKGTRIGPNVIIKGNSKIGSEVIIDGTAFIEDSEIANNAHIKFCVRTEKVKIGTETSVGPFANLRPDTETGVGVRIGNFVETKKTILKDGAKAPHLSYVGDAEVGENTNIGAGTITCNYDGANKHKTILGKEVFIGSNSALVAPVKIEDGATVGAGSTISKDVPANSLAFTRAPMKIKQGWKRPKK